MADGLLIVIDVQRGFVNEHTAHVPSLVEDLQTAYDAVIATRFFNPPDSPFRRLIHWDRFEREGPDFPFAFAPRPDALVIDKSVYSCAGPKVVSITKEYGGRVDLCGIATDNCVLKTAVDLFEADLTPRVLAFACASHGGPACHEAGLLLLRRLIGQDQVIESGKRVES